MYLNLKILTKFKILTSVEFKLIIKSALSNELKIKEQ